MEPAAESGLPGRLILVNTTEASFPFIEALKGKGRVVITATNSAAQKYATVFPEYFVKALSEASTDLDKNGRTSIFEVFEAASLAVKQHYEQRGQLTTERALLDDNGDGLGREEGAGRSGRRHRAPLASRCRAGRRDRPTPSWRHCWRSVARSRPRPSAEAAQGRHAPRRVAGGLREADDRTGARVAGDPQAQLVAPPLDALALRAAEEKDQHHAGDETHHVGPERDAAGVGLGRACRARSGTG
jgi:hypothetical protein